MRSDKAIPCAFPVNLSTSASSAQGCVLPPYFATRKFATSLTLDILVQNTYNKFRTPVILLSNIYFN